MFDEIVDDKVGLADRALDDDLRRLELEKRHRDAELIAAILVAEAPGLYGRDGHRSMNGYLRATFNWSTSEAIRWRAHARAVGAIDGLRDALAAGRIGTSHVATFARAHSNPRVRDALDRLASTLIRHAEELSFRDFDAVMTHVVQLADEDGADQDEADAIQSRTATAVAVDGSLYLKATGGDTVATAELIAIVDRFVEREFRADAAARRAEHGDSVDGVPLPRTDAQRRHDAIHAALHLADAALAGHIRRVVVDSQNHVIDFGRRRRLFTGPAREAALVLLRTCEHPGCEVRAEVCHVDHSIEWNEFGFTDQANAGGRCDPPNREKHRKRWRTRKNSAGRTFTIRADGTIMLPVGARPPVFPDEADDRADDASDAVTRRSDAA